MKRLASLFLAFILSVSLCACGNDNSSTEQGALETGTISNPYSISDTQEPSTESQNITFVYEAWNQPEQSDLKDFLKEQVDTFSTQVLTPGDTFKAELQNYSYNEIEDSELYSAWKAECLSWAYGALNFDLSNYECDTALEETLRNCGELAYKFPDAFKASYYHISDNASQDFSMIGDELQAELFALIDIIYAKDTEQLSVGDFLEGNEFVSFALNNVYYEDDKLLTKSGDGIVYVVPEQQSILVLEFTVKNVFSQELSYDNTGIGSTDKYIKVDAVFGDTYEYEGDIYVEDSYGYGAVKDSFLSVTPLSERTMYAIIQVPVSAKEMSALVSVEYNGVVYQYSI